MCSTSKAKVDKLFDVQTFGALGDGVHDDHKAIQAAMNAAGNASAQGFSVTLRLRGPKVYAVGGPLKLAASNLHLDLQESAVLRFLFDPDLNFTRTWPMSVPPVYDPLITIAPAPGVLRLSNVTIAGSGVIDGKGWMWWPFRYHVWEHCCAPAAESHFPPYMLTVMSVDKLVVANLTLLDPPSITLNGPAGCTDAEIYGLNISASWLRPEEFYSTAHSPHFAEWRRKAPISDGNASRVGRNGTCGTTRWGRCEPPNTDGIDPGLGSRRVHVHDIFIENGDDSVVIKPGWGPHRPADCTRDVLVENVRIFRGMGANIGGMGSGCVQNVTFRNITLNPVSLAGVEIKTEIGKDPNSFIRDVLYEKIEVVASFYDVNYPCVQISSGYVEQGFVFKGGHYPKISNITYRDMDARRCPPIKVICNKLQPCSGITFQNVRHNGLVCGNANCSIDAGPAASALQEWAPWPGISAAATSSSHPAALSGLLLAVSLLLAVVTRRRLVHPGPRRAGDILLSDTEAEA